MFHTGSDSIQAFVAAIDSLGDWKWAMHAGGPLEDRGYGIEADSACRLYFCGYFDVPSALFGTDTVTSFGRKDGFVARIDGGCFDYIPDAIEPVVLDECNPTLPNVFTPNGDGINDCISVSNEGCIESMKCVFYNRWGQLVYESSEKGFCWDSRNINGALVPAGTYFYVYEGELRNGKSIVRKGQITILR
jgi:gliding motility-associated-like protein